MDSQGSLYTLAIVEAKTTAMIICYQNLFPHLNAPKDSLSFASFLGMKSTR